MAAELAPFEKVGQAFLGAYFKRMVEARSTIGSLYGPNSLLTFEGTKVKGAENISKKLNSQPKMQFRRDKIDIQPSGQGVLIVVTGMVKIEGEANPVKFSQTFILSPIPGKAGSFFCSNEIFRFNYGA